MILIIDDNPSVVDAFERLYADELRVTVKRCNSTREALQAIEEVAPLAIFIDHILSCSDGCQQGLEVVEHLRQQPGGAALRLFSISGGLGSSEEHAYRSLGVEIVGKDPVDVDRAIKLLLAS